jgi:nuclear transport factor 2 (NTF2) superfamily protein
MSVTKLQEFANGYTAAWNSGRPENVAVFFAEDATLSVNGAANVGRDAITQVAQGFMTAFPDMELLNDKLEILPASVRYHWTFIGTNTGPGGTGQAVRFSGFEEWTFNESGLVAISRGQFDEDEYGYQLEHGVEGSAQ